jgi:hypothetical protein
VVFHNSSLITLTLTLTLTLLILVSYAQAQGLNEARVERANCAPYTNDVYPDNVYFGDTHLHTSYSTDADFLGNRIDPREAYLYAKGEVITSRTG